MSKPEEGRGERIGTFLMGALMLLLPITAISLVAYNVVVVSTPDLMKFWVAVPVGVVLGFLVVAGLTGVSGNDAMDLIVTSVQIIVVALLLMPLAWKAKAQRHQRLQQKAPVRALASGNAPSSPGANPGRRALELAVAEGPCPHYWFIGARCSAELPDRIGLT